MTKQEIINGLLKLRKELCLGPSGAVVDQKKEYRYLLLTEAIYSIHRQQELKYRN